MRKKSNFHHTRAEYSHLIKFPNQKIVMLVDMTALAAFLTQFLEKDDSLIMPIVKNMNTKCIITACFIRQPLAE